MPGSRCRKESAVILPRWMKRCRLAVGAGVLVHPNLVANGLGRFVAALPQSPCPPGLQETEPSTKLMRATRVGGSSLPHRRALRRCKTQKTVKQSSRKKAALTGIVIVFMRIPFSPSKLGHGAQ